MAALILLAALASGVWPDSVVALHLQFDPAQWAYACSRPDLEIQVEAAITVGQWTAQCTMQIRGQTSSYYPKKSIKIRLEPGSSLFGFDEMNLNAQYSDRSRIRENLSYLYHAHCGQIVPVTAMTQVFFNGSTQGPYLFVEDVDGDFALRSWLPDDAVIYKCREYGSSLNSPHALHLYLKKTFEGLPMSDLEWFIRWLNTAPEDAFLAGLQGRLHFDALLSCVAANTLIGHGSTYYHNYHMVLDSPGAFGRWRMVPWDMDKTWGSSSYGPDLPYYWVTNDVSEPNTLLWRLWCAPSTRGLLLARLSQLSQGFDAWTSGGVVDSLEALVQPLVQVDPYRDYSMAQFHESVQTIRDWPSARLASIQGMLQGWPLPFRLHPTVSVPDGGILVTWSDAMMSSHYRVALSTDSTFLDGSAVYWETVTSDTALVVQDRSIGQVCYVQVRAFNSSREERALNRSVRLEPEPVIPRTGNVVINEVFYRNGDTVRPGDWIELANPGPDPVNLGGWAFRDSQDRNLHVLGDIVLPPGGFLVLLGDPLSFYYSYPPCPVDPRPFQFGLSADGETLRLYDYLGTQVDYVPYLPVAPWPSEPAQGGWSLSLISLERDNSNPLSWGATPDGGTPGLPNGSSPPWAPGYVLSVESVAPNPASGFITVNFSATPGGACSFTVVDLAGRVVTGPTILQVTPGLHSVALDVGTLPSGLYFIAVSRAGITDTASFVKLGP